MLQDVLVASGIWIMLAAEAWLYAKNALATRMAPGEQHEVSKPYTASRAA